MEAVILPIIHPTLNFENGIPVHPRVVKEGDEIHAMHVQMDGSSHTVEKVNELQVDELDSSQYPTAIAQKAVAQKFANLSLHA